MEIEAFARPQDRSRLRIAASCIHIRAGLEEKVTKGVMAVDSSPLPMQSAWYSVILRCIHAKLIHVVL